MRCAWCHNPEGISKKPVLMFYKDKCTLCRECKCCPNNVHEFTGENHILNRTSCNTCGLCELNCPQSALEISGKEMTTEEIMKQVERDREFYNTSGGGMTLSGGEPLFQPELALSLAREAKRRGISVCVETGGFCEKSHLLSLADYVDTFLFDFKISNDELHKKYTKVSNLRSIENLKALDQYGSRIILRCPVIEGVNDNDSHFEGVISLVKTLKNVKEIHLMPYHPLGVSKAEAAGEIPLYKNALMLPEILESKVKMLKENLSVTVHVST